MRTPWLRPKYLLFVLIGWMYVYVLWHDERFLVQPNHPQWQHFAPFRWWLLPHGMIAACALLPAPLQFSGRLRRRYPRLHRVIGRFYVFGVLAGAPLGIYIQYFEERLGGTRSFTMAAAANAFVWMLTTVLATIFILKRNVQLHRQWMTRSYACALIFLEVRVVIGIFHWGRFAEIVVWSCVAAAVPLADCILQWQDLMARRAVQARKQGSLSPVR